MMAHDYTNDIDKLGQQLADLRRVLVKQAGVAAEDASSHIAPRAKQLARQFQQGGYGLSGAARRHPSSAAGAIVGAVALVAAFAWLLSSASTRQD